MFHANDRNSPHWSQDFVEHLRTVHFALIAVCLALIGLVQYEKPKDVSVAQPQLQEIKATIDALGTPSKLQDALISAGAMGGPQLLEAFGFEILEHNISISRSTLIWLPGQKTGSGELLSGYEFLSRINKKPNTLAEFRDLWNSLHKRLQVWSFDAVPQSGSLVIIDAAGAASVTPYKIKFEKVGSWEILSPRLSSDKEKLTISSVVHIESPECVYSVSNERGTMLLPATLASKSDFDGQVGFIESHPYWRGGFFIFLPRTICRSSRIG